MAPTRGQQPTGDDLRWLNTLTNLGPEKSLDRTSTLANIVFTSVAIVGTLLTGLGALDKGRAALREGPTILDVPAPLLLAAASVVGAIVAVLPSFRWLTPENAERWYTRQILRRGIAVLVALLCLGGAVVAATIAAARVTDTASDPRVSVTWAGAGKKTELTVKLELSGLPSTAATVSDVTGIDRKRRRVSLVHAEGHPDDAGELTIELTVPDAKAHRRIEVRSKVTDGSEVLADERFTFRRP